MKRPVALLSGMAVVLLFSVLLTRGIVAAHQGQSGTSAGREAVSWAIEPPARDLGQLLAHVDVVIRGHVTATNTYLVPLPPPPTAPAWKWQVTPVATVDRGNSPPQARTDYAVQVTAAVVGVPEPALTMTGPAAGTPLPGGATPVLQVGEDYLLLLVRRPDGRYFPKGREGIFLIRAEHVEPVQPGGPFLETLRDMPVDELIRRIGERQQP